MNSGHSSVKHQLQRLTFMTPDVSSRSLQKPEPARTDWTAVGARTEIEMDLCEMKCAVLNIRLL